MAQGIRPPTGGVPAIPIEALEHIIDHLHDDTPALSACATVCRAWLPSSYYHLFYTLQVVAEADHHRFTEFADFAGTASSACKYYLRHLCLRNSLGDPPPEDDTDVNIDIGLLASMIQNLVGLRSLTTLNLFWRGKSISDVSDIPTFQLPLLTKLTFDSLPQFCKLHQIQIAFQWFPSLSELTINGGVLVDPRNTIRSDSAYAAPMPLIPSALQLRLLHFDTSIYVPFFVQQISDTATSGSLQSLAFRITSPLSISGLGGLLRSVGPNLRWLDLNMEFMYTELFEINSRALFQGAWGLLDLSSASQLHSFTLRICAHEVDPFRDPLIHDVGWSFLPLLLETLVSPDLRYFKLIVAGEEAGVRDFVRVGNDWHACEEQFLRFDKLHTVEFVYSPNMHPTASFVFPEETRRQVESLLPELVRRGTLK